MKKEIFLTAWRFCRQTGLSFSECLCKAWANFKLRKRMQTEIVQFYYTKLDGSQRQAFGKLYDLPETLGTRKPNENLFTYFDTMANGWRSFYKVNILKVA